MKIIKNPLFGSGTKNQVSSRLRGPIAGLHPPPVVELSQYGSLPFVQAGSEKQGGIHACQKSRLGHWGFHYLEVR